MERTITRNAVIEQALSQLPEARLYRAVDGFDPGDEWTGEAPGPNGGTIHLIAQDDQHGCLYGETVSTVEDANYLVTTAYNGEAPELDAMFGDQRTWPDNYAQTHGWRIR